MEAERSFTIGENHPTLAGHFPGHPVVPGAVMLGEIMKAIREMTQGRIEFVGMPSAKFMSPLSPGETVTIRWGRQAGGTTEFTCTTGSRLIASGCLHYRTVADDSAGGS